MFIYMALFEKRVSPTRSHEEQETCVKYILTLYDEAVKFLVFPEKSLSTLKNIGY